MKLDHFRNAVTLSDAIDQIEHEMFLEEIEKVRDDASALDAFSARIWNALKQLMIEDKIGTYIHSRKKHPSPIRCHQEIIPVPCRNNIELDIHDYEQEIEIKCGRHTYI